MRLEKKGQAALEFLMTYGWAILVVLAAIAALAYFGVFSPSRFLPEKCLLPSGLSCIDSAASTAGLTVVVQNAAGFDMSNVVLSLSGSSACAGNGNHSAGGQVLASLPNGNKTTVTWGCTLSSGSKYSGTLVANYTNADTSLAHMANGELIKKVA
jgi:uncharacterized protein (UPF0333 family)